MAKTGRPAKADAEEKVSVYAKVSETVEQRLREIAEEKEWSLAKLISVILRDHVQDNPKKK